MVTNSGLIRLNRLSRLTEHLRTGLGRTVQKVSERAVLPHGLSATNGRRALVRGRRADPATTTSHAAAVPRQLGGKSVRERPAAASAWSREPHARTTHSPCRHARERSL